MKGIFRAVISILALSICFVSSAVANTNGANAEDSIAGLWSRGNCEKGLVFGQNGKTAQFENERVPYTTLTDYTAANGWLEWKHPGQTNYASAMKTESLVYVGPEFLVTAQPEYYGTIYVTVYQRCFDDHVRSEAARIGVEIPDFAFVRPDDSGAMSSEARVGVWSSGINACQLPSNEDGSVIAFGVGGDWVSVNYDKRRDRQVFTHGTGSTDGFANLRKVKSKIEVNDYDGSAKVLESENYQTRHVTLPGFFQSIPVLIDVNQGAREESKGYFRCWNDQQWEHLLNSRFGFGIRLDRDAGGGIASALGRQAAAWWGGSPNEEPDAGEITFSPPSYVYLEGMWGVVVPGSRGVPVCTPEGALKISTGDGFLEMEADGEVKRFSGLGASREEWSRDISGGWYLSASGREFGNIIRVGADQFVLKVTEYSYVRGMKESVFVARAEKDKDKNAATTRYGRCS